MTHLWCLVFCQVHISNPDGMLVLKEHEYIAPAALPFTIPALSKLAYSIYSIYSDRKIPSAGG